MSADVTEKLKELKNDKEQRVRFCAFYGLSLRSPEGMKDFVALWKSPETTADERNDMIP